MFNKTLSLVIFFFLFQIYTIEHWVFKHFHQQTSPNFPSKIQSPSYNYRPNDNKLVFMLYWEMIRRCSGSTVEMCHCTNIVGNHSVELLFSIDNLLKDHNFA